MSDVLSTALVCATVLWLARRGEALVRDHWARFATPAPVESWTPEPMPPAVMGLALRESELWAQQQAQEVLKGMYTEMRDWNKVLTAYTSVPR